MALQFADRAACGALLAAAGVLLGTRLPPRPERVAWSALAALALANALVLSLQPHNLVNNNNVQQYLGAKYRFAYADFQTLVDAARDDPQIGLRDLQRPGVILHTDTRAQRAYFIDLLRAAHEDFDPLAPLEDLRARCRESGALHAESARVLARGLRPGSIDGFRRDVQAAAPRLHWVDIVTDYGFNGSPFYVLVRQADPAVHRPFGPATAVFGLWWQFVSLALLAWILSATFGLGATQFLMAGTLVLSSWDFTAYVLPGLTFGGLWLPVAVAALALRRGRPKLAGPAVAAAGLMKLFPFLLLLPPAATLAGALWRRIRRSGGDRPDPAARGAWNLVVSCGITAVALGWAAGRTGRSWTGFLAKITAEFGPQSYIMNSVSVGHGLFALGVHNSAIFAVVSILMLGIVVTVCSRSGEDGEAQARLVWVVIACTGLIMPIWFNYYALAPLFLLPVLRPEHRRGTAVAAVAMAAATLLPDFDDPSIRSNVTRIFKLAPYIALPAWLLCIELRGRALPTAVRRTLVAVAAGVALLVAGEALRMGVVRKFEREGDAALDAGRWAAAETAYARLLQLAPRHAAAEVNLGFALAQSGRGEAAGSHFARAAACAPADPNTLQNYGLWLRQAGRLDEAAAEFEKMRGLTPWDDGAWYELARIRFEQGRAPEAAALAARALELAPENQAARALLQRTGGPAAG